jgi:hypothetical protein
VSASDTGRGLLQTIGVKGLDKAASDRLRALPRWLGA